MNNSEIKQADMTDIVTVLPLGSYLLCLSGDVQEYLEPFVRLRFPLPERRTKGVGGCGWYSTEGEGFLKYQDDRVKFLASYSEGGLEDISFVRLPENLSHNSRYQAGLDGVVMDLTESFTVSFKDFVLRIGDKVFDYNEPRWEF